MVTDAADSATLARGLAIEQAAQLLDTDYANLSVGEEWVLSYPKGVAARIRSLDPDAAQALAEHDAQWESKWKLAVETAESFASQNLALTKEKAEIERRARLPLEERLRELTEAVDDLLLTTLIDRTWAQRERVAIALQAARTTLSESQPAPATQEERLK